MQQIARMASMDRKARKEYFRLLDKQFGFHEKIDCLLYISEKSKVYLAGREIASIPLDALRTNVIGLYVAEVGNGELRLSIEGSQMFGPKSSRNILEISPGDARRWMKGEDIEIPPDKNGFVLVKSGDDFFGTGKAKQGTLLNFIPKARRLNVAD